MTVYSAGYGNRSFPEFLRLLEEHQITMVWDVRSKPYSGWNPSYNKQSLKKNLPMHYWYMGDVLGGMEDIPLHVVDMALDELILLSQKERICVMCSELKAEPTKRLPSGCHRHFLIAKRLRQRGVQVIHL